MFRRAFDGLPWLSAARLLRDLGVSVGGANKSIRKGLLLFPAEILERLVNQPFPEPALVPVYVKAHLNLGTIERELGRHQKAVTTFAEAIKRAEQLGRDYPSNVDYQLLSSNAQTGLALVYQNLKRYPDAGGALQRALNIVQRLVQEHPSDATCHEALAHILFTLAALYKETGRFPEAASTLRQVQQVVAKTSRLQPSFDVVEHGLLPRHCREDDTEPQIKWLHLAVAALRDASEAWRVMAKHHLEIPNFDDDLIGGLAAAEVLYHQIGPANLNEDYRQNSLDQRNQDRYGYFQLAVAQSYESIGLPNTAKRAYGKAMTVLDQRARACPKVRKYRIAFVMAQSGMGRMTWNTDADAYRWKQYPRTAMSHQQTSSARTVAATTPN